MFKRDVDKSIIAIFARCHVVTSRRVIANLMFLVTVITLYTRNISCTPAA